MDDILQKAVAKAQENTNIIFLVPRIFPRHLIFSHDFAKAFWGEGKKCSCGGIMLGIAGIAHEMDCDCIKYPNWKHALSAMVLEEDPIKFLERFL